MGKNLLIAIGTFLGLAKSCLLPITGQGRNWTIPVL
jgi:hypothetical protein